VNVAQAVGETRGTLGVRHVFGLIGGGNFAVTKALRRGERFLHRQPVVGISGVSMIVASLQDILDQRLVPVIASVSDAKAVGKWARGERSPRPSSACATPIGLCSSCWGESQLRRSGPGLSA